MTLRLQTATVTLLLASSILSAANSYSQESPRNRVIDKLQANQPVIGSFTRTPGSELDFAIIDEQYGEFDLVAVREALVGMQINNRPPAVAPIVRIPLAARDQPKQVVQQLLDAGVFGLMFPDIETQQQAMSAIASMRFAQFQGSQIAKPAGVRGSGRASAPGYWGLSEFDYREQADVWPLNPDGKLVAMIQIESPRGIANLDAILEVPGIGVLFLGPTDIAIAINAEGPNAPEVESLVQEVLQVCLERNIACGYPIVATSAEQAERETARRLQEGFKVLAVMTRAQ